MGRHRAQRTRPVRVPVLASGAALVGFATLSIGLLTWLATTALDAPPTAPPEFAPLALPAASRPLGTGAAGADAVGEQRHGRVPSSPAAAPQVGHADRSAVRPVAGEGSLTGAAERAEAGSLPRPRPRTPAPSPDRTAGPTPAGTPGGPPDAAPTPAPSGTPDPTPAPGSACPPGPTTPSGTAKS